MTNGEKLCIDFPNMHYALSEKQTRRVVTTIGVCASFDLEWWNAEYKEPTIKNDLGVDCISRAYLLDDSKYHTVFNDDTGNFEDVVYREDIEKAPPVTPIRPKGHWIFDGDCLSCSKCKKAYSFSGSNFCPNCGVDMREVEGGRKME